VNVDTDLVETDFCARRSLVRARRALLAMNLHEAMRELDQMPTHAPEDLSLSPQLRQATALFRALIHGAQDDFGAARSIAVTFPVAARQPMFNLIVRVSCWKKGEPTSCGELAAARPSPVRAPRHVISPILEQCLDAMLEFLKMRPVLASRLAEEALHMAREHLGRDSATTLLPATVLAESLYEQGRLEEADNLVRFRIPAIRSAGTLECATRAYVLLARISMHRGCRDFASSLLRDARALGERRSWPRLVAVSWAEWAQQLLDDGDIAAAENCARELAALLKRPVAMPAAVQQAICMQLALVELRIAIARGHCTEARERLAQLSEEQSLDSSNALGSLQLQLQSAAAQSAGGCTQRARDILIRALETGAGNGLCMTFLDAGRVVRQLIAELAGEPPDAQIQDLLPYVRSLLRHFDRAAATSDGPRRATTEVRQSLTRRESGILQLIARGLSNKRIALRLDITPETVKTHAKSIFLKLAAQTRAQAVSRAEALGII